MTVKELYEWSINNQCSDAEILITSNYGCDEDEFTVNDVDYTPNKQIVQIFIHNY